MCGKLNDFYSSICVSHHPDVSWHSFSWLFHTLFFWFFYYSLLWEYFLKYASSSRFLKRTFLIWFHRPSILISEENFNFLIDFLFFSLYGNKNYNYIYPTLSSFDFNYYIILCVYFERKKYFFVIFPFIFIISINCMFLFRFSSFAVLYLTNFTPYLSSFSEMWSFLLIIFFFISIKFLFHHFVSIKK